MKISPPFCITSRLMCGARINDGEISIGYSKRPGRDGRVRYQYHIDIPGCEHEGDDLQSGAGGGSISDGMESLLSFLSAAAESYSYHQRTGRPGENEDLFPPQIVAWAYQNDSEITMLELDLEENPNLIDEDNNDDE